MSLARGEYLPFDTGQYMQRLRREIPELDSVVDLYIIEALNCFRSGNYLGSVVMVGVASERILLVLRDSLLEILNTEEKKQKFREATERVPIKRVYEETLKRVDPVREQMPDKLSDTVGVGLSGIFEFIRQTRNDAGHPTGIKIAREDADGILLLFPKGAKTAYALRDWLRNNPI